MSREAIPNVMVRHLPDGVTYDVTSADHVIISLPPGSTWSSGLHWHEGHTEYLKVVQGSIRVRVGTRTRIVSASATSHPEIRIDKFVSHEWQRAEPGGDEVRVLERSDPPDGEKTLFFRNLNGVMVSAPNMLDQHELLSRCPTVVAQVVQAAWVELKLMVIYAHLDNIPVYLDLPSSWLRKEKMVSVQCLAMMDWVLSHLILSMAALIGWIVGVQPVDRRFTPEEEVAYWESGRSLQ